MGMPGLYEKRGWYYYRPPTPKGAPRSASIALRTQDYLTAVTLAVTERDTTSVQHSARHGTLEEILPRYYRDKNEHKKSTRIARIQILDGFKDILGNPRIDQIDEEMMGRWWDHLGEKGGSLKAKRAMKPSSKKSYLITVRAFLNWAIAERLLKGDPIKRLRMHTRVKSTRVDEFLTEDEREKLLAAASDKPDYLKLILHLGFFAGMRDSEMLAMKREWVWISPEKDRGTISIQDTPIQFQDGSQGTWQPKGKRTRVIPLHPRLIEFLLDYGMREPFMLAPEKDRWPNDDKKSKRFEAKKSLSSLGDTAGLSRNLNYHILRHSFATHLAMKGAMLAEIAGLLGDGLKVTEDHYAGFCASRTNPLSVL